MFNCFCQLIVLLYVCDNDTNFMIKVSIGVGLLIECWKLTKVRISSKILVHVSEVVKVGRDYLT